VAEMDSEAPHSHGTEKDVELIGIGSLHALQLHHRVMLKRNVWDFGSYLSEIGFATTK
jgi:hypothetical protein